MKRGYLFLLVFFLILTLFAALAYLNQQQINNYLTVKKASAEFNPDEYNNKRNL